MVLGMAGKCRRGGIRPLGVHPAGLRKEHIVLLLHATVVGVDFHGREVHMVLRRDRANLAHCLERVHASEAGLAIITFTLYVLVRLIDDQQHVHADLARPAWRP